MIMDRGSKEYRGGAEGQLVRSDCEKNAPRTFLKGDFSTSTCTTGLIILSTMRVNPMLLL